MFLAYYSDWVRSSQYEPLYKNFLLLAALNSLEAVSYTAKDGQYLRWDHRSQKVIETNNRREKAGRPPLKTKFDKGPIPFAKDIIVEELQAMVSDVRHIQDQGTSENGASICVFQRSVLEALPAMEGNSIDGVITSPPYCNRYDYTRTYALELAFLGLDNEDIKTLRQELLTCTVENRSKIAQIEKVYNENGRSDDFFHVMQILNKNEAIREVLAALHKRQQAGELNNDGIIRMVEGYFTELAFVYAELFRVVKPDAYVAFVNDNVRYAGEIIPVDFISCELATAFGFKVEGILCIEQQKGNSSQQMKRYGRVPLRKSITIWKK
jgi:site-specific DNA-methyltransferase (cytosine-N4-specific)